MFSFKQRKQRLFPLDKLIGRFFGVPRSASMLNNIFLPEYSDIVTSDTSFIPF